MKKLKMLIMLLVLNFYAEAQTQEVELARNYAQNGEYEKARQLYEKELAANNTSGQVYKEYMDVLWQLEEYRVAEKFLKKRLKQLPADPTANIDYGRTLLLQKDSAQALKHLRDYISSVGEQQAMLNYIALNLVEQRLYGLAEEALQLGIKNGFEQMRFSLARVYGIQSKKEEMLAAYLEALQREPEQLERVEVELMGYMKTPDDLDWLQPLLIKGIQQSPGELVFNELLLWYWVQQKEFIKAFVQAKAIDRRKKLGGFGLLELGKQSLASNAYDAAVDIFSYLTERFEGEPVYPNARRYYILSQEEQVRNTFPIDYEKIKNLVQQYDRVVADLGINAQTANALRSSARLRAFYLNQPDSAIYWLKQLTELVNIPREEAAQAKLDLGDVYLHKGEPWEASLLYARVEKSERESDLGHEAKLKKAKLFYYTGDFELAAGQLDILKLATSRKIANDALDLAILIRDNLALDTTAAAMEYFAATDLLVYQGRVQQGLVRFEEFLRTFPGHSLTDEAQYRIGQLSERTENYQAALNSYLKLLETNTKSIYADDAVFRIGYLYQEHLNNNEKAMEYYLRQLTKHKGSVHNIEARKRVRALRGDKIN